MLVKREVNTLLQMDSFYLKDFSYTTMREKFNQLQERYSKKEILTYFLNRANAQTSDNTIIKYALPIFYLDKEFLLENAEIILESISNSTYDWIKTNIGKDKLDFLNEQFVIQKLSRYEELPKGTLYWFVYGLVKDGIEKNNQIQNILFNMTKYVAEEYNKEKLSFEEREEFFSFMRLIYDGLKELPIKDPKWQEILLNMILKTNSDRHILEFLLGRKITRESMLTIIDYINNIKKPMKRDIILIEMLQTRILENYLDDIDIKNIIELFKKKDIHAYAKLLFTLKIRKKEYKEYTYDFCRFIWKLIQEQKYLHVINKGVSSPAYMLMEFLREFQYQDIIDEIYDFLMKEHYDFFFKPFTYRNGYAHDKQLQLEKIISGYLVKVVVWKASQNEEFLKILKNIINTSENKSITSWISMELTWNKNISREVALVMINKMLTTGVLRQSTEWNPFLEYIRHLDIAQDESLFNQLISLNISSVTSKCNYVIAKQLSNSLSI